MLELTPDDITIEAPKIKTEIKQMKDADYFKSSGISNSDFRLLKESALHLKNKELFKLESSAMMMGTALHCLVLQPELFDEEFIVEDFHGMNLNKNSNQYKACRAEWEEQTNDRKIIEKIVISARRFAFKIR